MKKITLLLLSASLVLASCGTQNPVATQLPATATSVTHQTATAQQTLKAQQLLKQGLNAQGINTLSAKDVNWELSTTVRIGDSGILTAPTKNGSSVIIGLDTENRDEPLLSLGKATIDNNGHLIIMSKNISTGVQRTTTVAPDGDLISEVIIGKAPRLRAQYTCSEFRDRVDDARDEQTMPRSIWL